MSKPALRAWVGGTAAAGAVLSIAGLGLASAPAANAVEYTCATVKGGTFQRLPVDYFHDVATYGYNYWDEFDESGNGNGYICFRWTRSDGDRYYEPGEKGVLRDDVVVS